jgi:hypothetical protein
MTYDLERMQTDKPADWIAKVAAQNPATLLPSGNVRVFGRGAFVNVAAPAKDSTDAAGNIVKGKFGMTLLFPTGYDLTALRKARADLIPTAFPKNPQGIGLKDPIKDQATLIRAFAAARQPDVMKRFEEMGFDYVGSSPADGDKRLEAERDKWRDVIKRANIKVDL